MGVKHLWDIVSPSCERKPLFELHGKTIAIDLSCWVVDSQSVTDNVAQPKMYLRNLYFRTVYLLMQGVSPVFVLEGAAPTLKHTEIARRNDLRRPGEQERSRKKGGRSRFNTVLKECQTMLDLMGLKCVKGYGEAEAMCAYLNEDGLVDGCISQDSDCFLYGAKTVYRNFCTSVVGNRGSRGGSIDVYSMEKIERSFKLDRRKMIALALLCGCDYDKGVYGIGKEAALKLFEIVDDEDILERIKSWRSDRRFERMASRLRDPNVCASCGHEGKLRAHTKSGCADCGTVSKCKSSYKEQKARMAHEIGLRQKALSSEEFPSQDLIDEFLVRKGPMPTSLDLAWRKPKIVEFVSFMVRHVCWEPEYAFAKIFPLSTRWQLRHFAPIPRADRLFMQGVMIPEKIKKIRNLRGVASYEIVWTDNDGILDGLTLGKTSDKENESDEAESDNAPDELVSIEPQSVVLKCYPELVEEFEAARQAKKKRPARKKKIPPTDNDDGTAAAAREPKKKIATRRPRKKAAEVQCRKIDEFVQIVAPPSLEDSFETMTISPKRRKPSALKESRKANTINTSGTPKRGPQFDRVMATARSSSVLDGTLGMMFDELTPEDFPSEIDDYTIMGDVIEELCSQRTTRTTNFVDLMSDDVNSNGDDEREMEEAIERLCGKGTTRRSSENLLDDIDGDRDDERAMEEAIERLCGKGTIRRSSQKSLDGIDGDPDDERAMEEAIERLCGKGTTRRSSQKSLDDIDGDPDDERAMEEAIERLCGDGPTRRSSENLLDDIDGDRDDECAMEEAIERLCGRSSLSSCGRDDRKKNEKSTKRSSNYKRGSKSLIDEEPRRSFARDARNEESSSSKKKKAIPVVENSSDESDEFDVVYVPLSQRIKPSKPLNSKRNERKASKNFNLGIDDIMRDSD